MSIHKSELNLYINKIKAIKAKITPQRIEILKLFLQHKDEHFTAENVIKQLDDSQIGQATVYRTLELFCQAGILKKINFKNEEVTRYDLLNLNERHFHHHLICNNCGKVIEIDDDLLDHIEAKVQNEYHFKILNHQLILNGICSECQQGSTDEE